MKQEFRIMRDSMIDVKQKFNESPRKVDQDIIDITNQIVIPPSFAGTVVRAHMNKSRTKMHHIIFSNVPCSAANWVKPLLGCAYYSYAYRLVETSWVHVHHPTLIFSISDIRMEESTMTQLAIRVNVICPSCNAYLTFSPLKVVVGKWINIIHLGSYCDALLGTHHDIPEEIKAMTPNGMDLHKLFDYVESEVVKLVDEHKQDGDKI